MNNIKQTIEMFAKEVESVVGNVEMRISHSQTDFGQSSYLYVGPFKVRCSDHSTGIHRIMSELNLCELTKQSILETIERYFFPERFKKVVTVEFGDAHEASQNKINGLKHEYKVIEGNVRTSKKGQAISIIRVKNVEKTSFVKI